MPTPLLTILYKADADINAEIQYWLTSSLAAASELNVKTTVQQSLTFYLGSTFWPCFADDMIVNCDGLSRWAVSRNHSCWQGAGGGSGGGSEAEGIRLSAGENTANTQQALGGTERDGGGGREM